LLASLIHSNAYCAYFKGLVTEPTDQDLVNRVLGLLPMNNYEAASALRVAEGTIRRWRKGRVGALRPETRIAILAYLGMSDDQGVAGSRGGSTGASDGELWKRLDAIEAQDLDEWTRIWKIREVAATYRAKALADLADALRHEGLQAELRGEAALARAYGAAESPEEASRRALVAEAVRTKHVPPELIEGKALPHPRKSGARKAGKSG
jgi:hypothetical protein